MQISQVYKSVTKCI